MTDSLHSKITKRSARLILYASAVYAVAVYLYRGLLPSSFPSAVTLLVIPLCLLVVILYSDLFYRARLPAKTDADRTLGRSLNREVELLSRQVEVAGKSSPDYYETVLLSRLREALIDKVSIETGLDKMSVKQKMASRTVGSLLLHDSVLYQLLFTANHIPIKERQRTLEMIADRIGNWTA